MRALPLILLLTMAGCVTPPGVEEQPAANFEPTFEKLVEDPSEAPRAWERIPIRYQGKTATGACVRDAAASCAGAPVGTASENAFFEPAYEGAPVSIFLTMTWTATSPATQEMTIALLGVRSCGDGCVEARQIGYNRSISPLPLALTLEELAPDETIVLHVSNVDLAPTMPVPFFYTLEQPFSVEGSIDVRPTP